MHVQSYQWLIWDSVGLGVDSSCRLSCTLHIPSPRLPASAVLRMWHSHWATAQGGSSGRQASFSWSLESTTNSSVVVVVVFMYIYLFLLTPPQLIYNIVLVSGVPQSDSVIHIHMYFSDSFPLYIIMRYWIKFPVLYSRSLLFTYFIYSNVYLFYLFYI